MMCMAETPRRLQGRRLLRPAIRRNSRERPPPRKGTEVRLRGLRRPPRRTIAARLLVAEAEEADPFIHGPGLLIERSGSSGVFFNHRGVLVGHRVHLSERLVDLLEPTGLLGARRRDVRYDVGHCLDTGADIEERSAWGLAPVSTLGPWAGPVAIGCLLSLARCAGRCARLRTSAATTAKPRPASPARAASTAALSASRLVCRAISSITPMMSEILREELSIWPIASTALATTSPPRLATSRALSADRLACCAFTALFFTVAAISSIEAEVSSRLAACSSVRWDRSVVLVEISAEALVTSCAAFLMSAMVVPIRSAVLLALSFRTAKLP